MLLYKVTLNIIECSRVRASFLLPGLLQCGGINGLNLRIMRGVTNERESIDLWKRYVTVYYGGP
jgi:hypothetical protein